MAADFSNRLGDVAGVFMLVGPLAQASGDEG
jgi:hypothetical protein